MVEGDIQTIDDHMIEVDLNVGFRIKHEIHINFLYDHFQMIAVITEDMVSIDVITVVVATIGETIVVVLIAEMIAVALTEGTIAEATIEGTIAVAMIEETIVVDMIGEMDMIAIVVIIVEVVIATTADLTNLKVRLFLKLA